MCWLCNWLCPRKTTPVIPPVPTSNSLSLDVTNNSSMSASDVAAAVAAVQAQYSQDYVPYWGGAMPQTYKIIFEDVSDVQGALGYHDLENDVATAYIFVQTSKDNGVAPSSVLSHEVLEMITDPITNRVIVTGPDTGKSGRLYMAEVCDAVEQDGYQINGVEVSNFVTPAWFDPSNTKGPYDKGGKLSAPLALLPGGSYIGILDFTSKLGWSSQQARKK